VRIAVKGFDPSPMSPAELDLARSLVADAMAAGAVGLSLGLMYVPECHMGASELTALMTEAARAGGLVSVHMRGEGASLLASVQEALSLARQAGAPLNISHLKAASQENWGAGLQRAIGAIADARATGQDVTCDAYPYAAGATMLQTLLPPEYQLEGLARLRESAHRERLRALLGRPGEGWDNLALSLGWQAAVVSATGHPDNKDCVGRSIADIAAERGGDPTVCLCDILLADEGRTAMVLHSMSPQDVDTVLSLPWSMVISDAIYPPGGQPHPRMYGAFPRMLRRALDGLMPLEQAVRKMTALPALRAGLADRGLLRRGLRADLVLFDEATVADRATYKHPAQTPTGIPWVFVGGQPAVAQGSIVNTTLGKYTERQVPTHGF
jgi:N-acyl-D-aspartate/D-glutamate deacylase